MAQSISRTLQELSGAGAAADAGSPDFGRNTARLPDSQTHDEGTLVVVPGGSVSGVIDFAGDSDTVSMTLSAGTYLISLVGSGATPLIDPFLGSNIAGVDDDDDGGSGYNSLITFTVASAGTYTFDVSAFAGSDLTGGYTVNLVQRGSDSVPGTISSTVAANIDAATFGFIETSGDVDVYRVSLTAGLFYDFELQGGGDYASDYPPPTGELDTLLTVYDAGGNVVFTSDDQDFDNGDIGSGGGFLAETGGFYYVEVSAYPGDT